MKQDDTASHTVAGVFASGGTNRVSAQTSPTNGTYIGTNSSFLLNPATSAPFTQSDITGVSLESRSFVNHDLTSINSVKRSSPPAARLTCWSASSARISWLPAEHPMSHWPTWNGDPSCDTSTRPVQCVCNDGDAIGSRRGEYPSRLVPRPPLPTHPSPAKC